MKDAREWVRWWRIEGLDEMRSLLWKEWDPLALDGIAPNDEYDGYARVLASKLKRGNDRDDIAEYLTTALAERDTLIPPSWRAKCQVTADALIQWYDNSNAPR